MEFVEAEDLKTVIKLYTRRELNGEFGGKKTLLTHLLFVSCLPPETRVDDDNM